MTTLNADVLRIIIRQAADEAEKSSSYSPIDAFYHRSSTLRRLALVHPQWKTLAQLELQSFVVLTSRNFSRVSRAIDQLGMGKKVKRLVDRRGLTGEQKVLDEMLGKCLGLRELDCNNSRFSLTALQGSKHLHSLRFASVTLIGDAKNLSLPFRLRSFVLSGTCGISRDDWKALKESGTTSLEHLELVGRLSSNPAFLLDTLSAWLPFVQSLDIADVHLPTPLVPLLHLSQRLDRLSVKLSDFPSTLAVLNCSPRHLEIVASSEVLDGWTFQDYQSILQDIGKEPLDKLESVKISRSPGIHDATGAREVALLVKLGRRKSKANSEEGGHKGL